MEGRTMTRRLLLDTNALIALSDSDHFLFQRVESELRNGAEAVTCAVAWHEYVRGPMLPEDRSRALRVIQARIVPLDRQDAEKAAELYNQTGRRRGSTADCLIAACAIRQNCTLFTANIDDFRPFVPFGLQWSNL